MIEKTKTALETGSCGSRVLGMPRPMGTQDAEFLRMRSTGSEAGRSKAPVGITCKGDKMCLIKNNKKSLLKIIYRKVCLQSLLYIREDISQ